MIDWIAKQMGLSPAADLSAEIARKCGLPSELLDAADDEVSGALLRLDALSMHYEARSHHLDLSQTWLVDPCFVAYGGADADYLGLYFRPGASSHPVVRYSHEQFPSLTWVAQSPKHLVEAIRAINRDESGDAGAIYERLAGQADDDLLLDLDDEDPPTPTTDERRLVEAVRVRGEEPKPADLDVLEHWYEAQQWHWHAHSVRVQRERLWPKQPD